MFKCNGQSVGRTQSIALGKCSRWQLANDFSFIWNGGWLEGRIATFVTIFVVSAIGFVLAFTSWWSLVWGKSSNGYSLRLWRRLGSVNKGVFLVPFGVIKLKCSLIWVNYHLNGRQNTTKLAFIQLANVLGKSKLFSNQGAARMEYNSLGNFHKRVVETPFISGDIITLRIHCSFVGETDIGKHAGENVRGIK